MHFLERKFFLFFFVEKSVEFVLKESDWLEVIIDSGNGLVPSGNKPLAEPMLTQIYVPIWHH